MLKHVPFACIVGLSNNGPKIIHVIKRGYTPSTALLRGAAKRVLAAGPGGITENRNIEQDLSIAHRPLLLVLPSEFVCAVCSSDTRSRRHSWCSAQSTHGCWSFTGTTLEPHRHGSNDEGIADVCTDEPNTYPVYVNCTYSLLLRSSAYQVFVMHAE